MWAFFAAIIMLVAFAFAFTTLPADFARLAKDSIKNLSLETFIARRVLTPLAKKIFEKSPEEMRLELIDTIAGELETLKEELGRTGPEKKDIRGETPKKIIRKTEDLLEELKSHNADKGFLAASAEKALSSILPSSENTCQEAPN